MLSKRLLIPVLAVAILGLALPAAAATAPLEQIRTTVDEVIATLKDKGLDGEARREKLNAIIRPRFDFQVMSRSVLGPNWRRISAAEREAFAERFADLLEATYIGRIESYTDEKVNYVGERVEGDRAEVETLIVTGSADLPIRYRLFRKGEEWRVYDVVIEEVSLVRNYRSTYDELIRKEGMDGLLGRMEKKLKELRNANAPEPKP